MYWFFLVIFIIAVLVPDIVRSDLYFLSETRLEESLIFLLGMSGFLIFIFKEHQLQIQQKEKEKSQKRLTQTAKDLVDSYSYIGEVNRKMDILMKIGLGLSDRTVINKTKEKEIYYAIIEAAQSVMKGECALLRFIDENNNRLKKEIKMQNCSCDIRNSELVEMKENVNIMKKNKFLAISSKQSLAGARSYLIVNSYDANEEKNLSNIEILKFLAMQALFLYSYVAREEKK